MCVYFKEKKINHEPHEPSRTDTITNKKFVLFVRFRTKGPVVKFSLSL
jgi:hypothetical protein